jgi:hypothetical protein
MPRKLLFPDERWCFPEAPSRIRRADRDEHWCFPENPPRVRVADPDERWCFPENPPRDRRRIKRR